MCANVARVHVFMLHVLVSRGSVNIVYGNFYLSLLVPHLCPKKWGTLRVLSICTSKWVTKMGNMLENTCFAPPIVLCWRSKRLILHM